MIPLMMSKWDEHYFHLERDFRVMASNDVFFVLVQVIKKATFGGDFFPQWISANQQVSRCHVKPVFFAGRTFLPGLHLWGFSLLRTSCTLFILSLNWITWWCQRLHHFPMPFVCKELYFAPLHHFDFSIFGDACDLMWVECALIWYKRTS